VGLARFTADMTTLEITAPDDLHLHVRDGNMLKAVLPHTTRIFRRSGVRMHRGSVGVGVCTRVHSAPSAPSPPRVRRAVPVSCAYSPVLLVVRRVRMPVRAYAYTCAHMHTHVVCVRACA
jgi:hypothetical protein